MPPRSCWMQYACLLLAQLKVELDQLGIRLEEADTQIKKIAQESEVCRRLDAIPGIGPLTATALIESPLSTRMAAGKKGGQKR